MKPGVTIRFLAGKTCRARFSGMSLDSSTIFPPVTAISIGACNFCPGSTTVPPLISKSNFSAGACGVPADRGFSDESSAAPPARTDLENSRRVIIKLPSPSQKVRNVTTVKGVLIFFGVRLHSNFAISSHLAPCEPRRPARLTFPQTLNSPNQLQRKLDLARRRRSSVERARITDGASVLVEQY